MMTADHELAKAAAIIAGADDKMAAAVACAIAGVRALLVIGGPTATTESLLNLAGRVHSGQFGSGQHHEPGNA